MPRRRCYQSLTSAALSTTDTKEQAAQTHHIKTLGNWNDLTKLQFTAKSFYNSWPHKIPIKIERFGQGQQLRNGILMPKVIFFSKILRGYDCIKWY